MVGKGFLVLCLQAALLQSISAQTCSAGPSSSSSSCGCSDSGFSRTATYSTGGPVSVTCTGPLSTNGLSLYSELGMEGQVAVTGSMPFLSAVALEGTLATSGSGTVAYGCGDPGSIVIVQESGNPSGNNAQSNSGLSLANLGNCGCRRQ